MEKKSVLIITEFEHAAHMLEKVFTEVFEATLNFSATTIRDIDNLTVIPNAIIMDASNYNSLIRNKGINHIEFFDLKYTLSRNGYEKLMRMKSGTEAFVFNINDKDTANTINLIHELGINDLVLKPLSSHLEYDLSKDIVITPNEAARINLNFKNIINIDDRRIDPLSLFNIAKRMNVLNEVVASRIYKCLQDSIPKIPGLINNSFKTNLVNVQDFNSLSSGLLKYVNGYIVFANKSALMFLGMKEQDLIGERPEKIFQYDSTINSNELIINIGNKSLYIRVHTNKENEDTGVIEILNEAAISKLSKLLSKNNTKYIKNTKYNFSNIIGENEQIKRAINLAKIFSKTNLHVLIEGESGTGKELFAQSIHNNSNRFKQSFIAFNCAALQQDLADSELFGYEAGAFTGANKNGKVGLIEAANGGTLFLDEIGELPPIVQSKLLRVIQEQEVLKVGSTEPIPIDIRFIAATNMSLSSMVKEGTFRQDLYYRINTLYLKIPPLRERKSDIELIVNSIIKDEQKALIFSSNLKKKIIEYSWLGNIRELRNFLNYLVSIYQSSLSETDKHYYAEHFFHRNDNSILEGHKNTIEINSNLCDLDLKVMAVIYDKTMLHLTIGRNGIHNQLKDKIPNLTESSLKQCLNSLHNKGYLEKGKGRSGSKLTSHGVSFFKKLTSLK